MTKSAPQQRAETRTPGRSQNSQRFKGIRKRKWGKWVSEIRIPNSRERIWLGSYDSAEQAARAYDAAVYCLRGGKATFNFPDTPPEIPSACSLSREQVKAAATRFALECPEPSKSDFTATVSLEEEDDDDFAFWESLLADSNSISCSNLNSDILQSPTPLVSPYEVLRNLSGE